MKTLILLSTVFVSSHAFACKLNLPGQAKLFVDAALTEFVKSASNDTVVSRIKLAEEGFVEITAASDSTDLCSVFKVSIAGPDCSTEVAVVKAGPDACQ